MGQVYQCWCICREINVFFRLESHVLSLITICDLFTDSPSYTVPYLKFHLAIICHIYLRLKSTPYEV
jgi:hypothetical protein